MFRLGAGALVLLSAVLASACTTGQLQPTMTSLSGATALAQSKLVEQQRGLNEAMLAYTTKVALANPGLSARVESGDCRTSSARCRLWIAVPGGRLPLTGTSGAEITQLMDGLVGYASDLAAIANAGNGAELAAATKATSNSIVALTGSIDSFATAAGISTPGLKNLATPLAEPLTQLVNIGLNQYVERRKIEAIRIAVFAMEPVLEEAVPVFDAIAVQSVEIARLATDDQFRAARRAYQASPQSADRLASYRRAADLYDVALQTQPTDVFRKLGAAHAALADALRSQRPSFDTVWPILDQVLQEAAKLAAAAEQIEKIKNS